MPSLSVDDRLHAAQELLNSAGLEAEFQRFIRDRKETESSKREVALASISFFSCRYFMMTDLMVLSTEGSIDFSVAP
jgi:hypothetical protein